MPFVSFSVSFPIHCYNSRHLELVLGFKTGIPFLIYSITKIWIVFPWPCLSIFGAQNHMAATFHCCTASIWEMYKFSSFSYWNAFWRVSIKQSITKGTHFDRLNDDACRSCLVISPNFQQYSCSIIGSWCLLKTFTHKVVVLCTASLTLSVLLNILMLLRWIDKLKFSPHDYLPSQHYYASTLLDSSVPSLHPGWPVLVMLACPSVVLILL